MSKSKQYPRLISSAERSFFLFGPRGTGKSTWLRQTYPEATVINLLDEKLYQRYLVDIGLFAQTLASIPHGSMVIVDEIQRLPQLLNEVHRMMEDRGLRFILSGSSARKLKQHGTNLLAGRAVNRDVHPFLPAELAGDFDLERVLAYGSIPVIWSQSSDPEALESYVQTYIKQEIQGEALVRNLPSFARFLQISALFHGQVLNISSLARDAGVQRTTVAGYLDVLDDTLMTFRLPAFKAGLRVKEKTHPKLYWFDPGVVRAIKTQLGPVALEERGALFEGFIAQTLRAYKSYRKLFDSWSYWASASHEVDFLLFKGDRCIAIEAKSGTRYRSEFTESLDLLSDAKEMKRMKTRKMVVYCGDDHLRTPTGVEVLPLQNFLRIVDSGSAWDF
jgi:uncharacterized protein